VRNSTLENPACLVNAVAGVEKAIDLRSVLGPLFDFVGNSFTRASNPRPCGCCPSHVEQTFDDPDKRPEQKAVAQRKRWWRYTIFGARAMIVPTSAAKHAPLSERRQHGQSTEAVSQSPIGIILNGAAHCHPAVSPRIYQALRL
jgi:hypothetical protein